MFDGQAHGWPLWAYLCLAASMPVLALLARWELHVERRGRPPLIPPHVLRRPSFSAGTLVGLVYFASFTSIFFTLSVVWQEGFGHGALLTGLISSPFAIGAIITSMNSDRATARLGRRVLTVGVGTVALGIGALILVVHVTGPEPSGWYLSRYIDSHGRSSCRSRAAVPAAGAGHLD